MSPTELTRALKAKATELGFHKVAIALAGPLERDRAALAAWLSGDRHASMAWMGKDPGKRSDPEKLLPGCRSVVALAVNYGPASGSSPTLRAGRVARYARGRDYHKVVGRMLKDLAAWLGSASGAVSRTFVDTGPVLERAWAEQAGLGWIGKNANLLTRDLGSWVLLGEILTEAALDPDEGPHEDFCGTCTACLDACPTNAIESPGKVDARLCISYWTIEHRGAIPESKREGIGDWIFGCDVCQEVCPWNKTFARSDDDPFGAREDLASLDPELVLGLDEATFRARFSGTALMRARWDGMRRNACIVLGNNGDSASLPALRAAASSDPDVMVREHALWAIARIEGGAI